MNFQNYNEITKSSDFHVEFLKYANTLVSQPSNQLSLSQTLEKNISVGGKPFSSAKYLTSLENNSDDWDLQFNKTQYDTAPSDSQKVQIAQLSENLMKIEPSFDLAHFTGGYVKMKEDLESRGIKINPIPQEPKNPMQSDTFRMLTEQKPTNRPRSAP